MAKVGVKSISISQVSSVATITAEGTCPIGSHMIRLEPKSKVTVRGISARPHHIWRYPRMGWKRGGNALLTEPIQAEAECPA